MLIALKQKDLMGYKAWYLFIWLIEENIQSLQLNYIDNVEYHRWQGVGRAT